MSIFVSKKEQSLGEKLAARLEQRGVPATGNNSQVFVFDEAKHGANVVLSLVPSRSMECWGGFWFWSALPSNEFLEFDMPSNYQFGVSDPLSIEIAFVEWVEYNGFSAGNGAFIGAPHAASAKGLSRYTKSNRRYPRK